MLPGLKRPPPSPVPSPVGAFGVRAAGLAPRGGRLALWKDPQ